MGICALLNILSCYVIVLSYRINRLKDFNFFKRSLVLSNSLREPLPNEEITLPRTNRVSGEILLDRDLIHRIALLRTFIEDIEINRGKKPIDYLSSINKNQGDGNETIQEATYDSTNTVSPSPTRNSLYRSADHSGVFDAKSGNVSVDEGSASIVEGSKDVTVGSKAEENCKGVISEVKNELQSGRDGEQPPDGLTPPVPINEENLSPIRELLCDESLLEEVLVKAFEVYHSSGDYESFNRLKDIAEEIIPIATKFRREDAEQKILRIIDCYTEDKEDLDKVLEELQSKRGLNKYLIHRLDELINIAAKKYRISEKHPAVSEKFLKAIKDRIAAQQISQIRGSDVYVKTLAKCFQAKDPKEYDGILTENIKSIEELEEFYEWLTDGIEYCRSSGRLEGKLSLMESVLEAIVRKHPIWTPKDDSVEFEEDPFEESVDDILKRHNLKQ